MDAMIMKISVPLGIFFSVFVTWLSVTTGEVGSVPIINRFQLLDVPSLAEDGSLERNLMYEILHRREKRQIGGENQTTTKAEITTKSDDQGSPKKENEGRLLDSTNAEAAAPGALPAISSKTDSSHPGEVTKIPTSQPNEDSYVDRKQDLSLGDTTPQITSLTGDRDINSSLADINPPEGKVAVMYPITSSPASPDSNSDKTDSVNEKELSVYRANPKANTTSQEAGSVPTTAKPVQHEPELGEIKDTVRTASISENIQTTTSLPSTATPEDTLPLPVIPLSAVNETTVGSVKTTTNATTNLPMTKADMSYKEGNAPPPPSLNNSTEKPTPGLMPANLVIPNTTTTSPATTTTTTSVSMTTDIPPAKVLNSTHFEQPPVAIPEPNSTEKPEPDSNTTTKVTEISVNRTTADPSILAISANETDGNGKNTKSSEMNKTEPVVLPVAADINFNVSKPDNVTEAATSRLVPLTTDSNVTTFRDISETATVVNITTVGSTKAPGFNFTEESNDTLIERTTTPVLDTPLSLNDTESVNATTADTNITSAENGSVVASVTEMTSVINVSTSVESVNITIPPLVDTTNVTNATTTAAELSNVTIPVDVYAANATTEAPTTNATADNATEITLVTNATTVILPVSTNETMTTEPVNLTAGIVYPATTPSTTATTIPTQVPNTTVVQNTTTSHTLPPTTTPQTTLQKIAVIITKSSTSTTRTTTTLSKSTEPQANNSAAVGQSQGLSASAMTAIITGSIIGFWIILGPIICLICKVRDKRKERYHTRLTNHSDPPADNGMLDAMIISELKKTSESSHDNGTTREKEKEYNTVANDKEETEKLKGNVEEHEF